MGKKTRVNFNKKDIIFSAGIAISIVFNVILAFSLSNAINYSRNSAAIISNHEKLVREAQFKCLEETGGVNCDYVELHEKLRLDYIDDMVKGELNF